jgi:hypothetical protein
MGLIMVLEELLKWVKEKTVYVFQIINFFQVGIVGIILGVPIPRKGFNRRSI